MGWAPLFLEYIKIFKLLKNINFLKKKTLFKNKIVKTTTPKFQISFWY